MLCLVHELAFDLIIVVEYHYIYFPTGPYLFRPTACTSRLLNSKVVETELPGEYTYKHKRRFLGRFWDWLHTDIGQDEYVSCEEDCLYNQLTLIYYLENG